MRLIDADAFRHRLLCQPPRNISINCALELVSTILFNIAKRDPSENKYLNDVISSNYKEDIFNK